MATLKTANLEIYIYTGTSGSYSSTDLKYTLQKQIISTETKIVFEFAELVRDYLNMTFNNDYTSITVWVTTVATLIDDSGVTFTYGSPVTNTYLAMDGYGYFEESINPQCSTDALITTNTIYIPENTAGKLPLYAPGVGKIIIDSTTTQITDTGNSNQKIQYATKPANSSEIKVYDTDDTTLKKTITIENVCEPKFSVFKITFVNKHGAFEDVYMFKKTVESFSVTDENYKSNIIDNSTVTYNTYKSQQTRYNVNAQSKIKLNTGYILEDANSTIEELFLSRNVWIRFENKTLPVVPTSKEFTFKTSLNDKLINYTINFEFAFNKINNVR